MPDTGSGRTCVCLSGLRGDPLQLPFLQESALPEVPAGGCRRMAQSAATAQAPCPLFSADVHAARGTAEGRAAAPEDRLQHPLPRQCHSGPEACQGPTGCGGGDWVGGGAGDGRPWVPSRKSFFLPVKALSPVYRAKFREGLSRENWFQEIPEPVWRQDWVVHCQPVGSGVAALKHLAPYIFRVALSNRRLVRLAGGRGTFNYRHSGSGGTRFRTSGAGEFIRRFLQHVLPKV